MRARVLSIVLCTAALGCADDPVELLIELRTDYTSGTDFTSVRTDLIAESEGDGMRVTSQSTELTVDGSTDFVTGAQVARFVVDTTTTYLVRVRLLRADGSVVAERNARAVVQETLGLTLVITRSCATVTCPAPGGDPLATTCVGGRCVPEACSPLDPGACGTGECDLDADCTPVVPCAEARCAEGACLQVPDDDACDVGQSCSLARGCTDVPPTCTDGSRNGAETDVDCGGPECDPCATGQGCDADGDCVTAFCGPLAGRCTLPPSVFTFTGTDQPFVVPPGITRIGARVWGAGGSAGGSATNVPGRGGFTRATLTVIPGQALTVVVGEAGRAIGEGVVYGGGAMGPGEVTAYSRGGGGGGLSGVFDGEEPIGWDAASQSRALVVAGGGGGGVAGGDGGGATGGTPTGGGAGGSETGGGAAATWGGNFDFNDCCRCCGCEGMCFPTGRVRAGTAPQTGAALRGGAGGVAVISGDWNGPAGGGTWSNNSACAGGGGGYFGGGGGWLGTNPRNSGGGGSSYVHPSATDGVMERGPNTSEPSYEAPAGGADEPGRVVLVFDVP